MNVRPPRMDPHAPLISPDPYLEDQELANWQYVYAGFLADGRSLAGGGGVYAAQVVAPLEITDRGIALDVTHGLFRQAVQQAAGGALPGGTTPYVLVNNGGGLAALTIGTDGNAAVRVSGSIADTPVFVPPAVSAPCVLVNNCDGRGWVPVSLAANQTTFNRSGAIQADYPRFHG